MGGGGHPRAETVRPAHQHHQILAQILQGTKALAELLGGERAAAHFERHLMGTGVFRQPLLQCFAFGAHQGGGVPLASLRQRNLLEFQAHVRRHPFLILAEALNHPGGHFAADSQKMNTQTTHPPRK